MYVIGRIIIPSEAYEPETATMNVFARDVAIARVAPKAAMSVTDNTTCSVVPRPDMDTDPGTVNVSVIVPVDQYMYELAYASSHHRCRQCRLREPTSAREEAKLMVNPSL